MKSITQRHGRETYVFRFDNTSEETMLTLLDSVAEKRNDTHCNFDDWDAAEVSHKFGQIIAKERKR